MYYITTVPNSQETNPQVLVFDAILDATPAMSKMVTSHKISDKSIINNHISDNPTDINVTGIITNSPVNKTDNNLIGYDDFLARCNDAYELLTQWFDNEEELVVATEYEIFSPVIMKSLVPTNNNGTESIKFQMTFQEFTEVGYQRVRLIQNVTEDTEKDGKGNSKTSPPKVEIPDDDGIFSTLGKVLKDSGVPTGLDSLAERAAGGG